MRRLQQNSPAGATVTTGEGGCRPCCSWPHGPNGVLTAALATVAWIFSLAGISNCHYLKPNYLYCHPREPKPPYGTCGDCHCINGDKPCPTDPDRIPLTDVPDDWLKQLKGMDAVNPYRMKCNMYNNTDDPLDCTDPPILQSQVDLWETAVCGLHYNMSSLDEESCPTEYTIKTYDTREEMISAGAEMTHWGACGACSTTRDLAVYLEYPDLSRKEQECSGRMLTKGFAEGVECFQEVGYTYDCAVAWMYRVKNSRVRCLDACIDLNLLGDGHDNGPPPECQPTNCQLCDEQMSGPMFETIAGRSRHRSGLLGKTVRDCESLLIVDHQPPCNVTRAKLSRQRQLPSVQVILKPEKWRPPQPTDTCVYITNEMGLLGYGGTPDNNWSELPVVLLSPSLYSTCYRHTFQTFLSGYPKEVFGAYYIAAVAFAVIACVLGGMCMVVTWVSTCCAYERTVWERLFVCYTISGLSMQFTLLFLLAEVCRDGCEMGEAAYLSIVAGCMWFAAAVVALLSSTVDDSIPEATCCCCPVLAGKNVAYSSVPDEDEVMFTEIVIVETKQEDGTTVIEKTIAYPNGSKAMERTILKKQSA